MAENKFVIEFCTESHYTQKELESFKNEMISWISEGDDDIVADSFEMKFAPVDANIPVTSDSSENKEFSFGNLSEEEKISIVREFLNGKTIQMALYLDKMSTNSNSLTVESEIEVN